MNEIQVNTQPYAQSASEGNKRVSVVNPSERGEWRKRKTNEKEKKEEEEKAEEVSRGQHPDPVTQFIP